MRLIEQDNEKRGMNVFYRVFFEPHAHMNAGGSHSIFLPCFTRLFLI